MRRGASISSCERPQGSPACLGRVSGELLPSLSLSVLEMSARYPTDWMLLPPGCACTCPARLRVVMLTAPKGTQRSSVGPRVVLILGTKAAAVGKLGLAK